MSWLPGKAESTEVLKATEQFSSPDEIPAVLVYERPDGITPADQLAVARHVTQYAELQDVDREVVGPIPSQDGRALQVLVPINAGSGGWETIGERAADIRRVAADRPDGMSVHITGPGGIAADSSRRHSRASTAPCLYGTVAVVIVILLVHVSQPRAVAAAGGLRRGVTLICAQAVVICLAKHTDLTVNAQGAGIVTVLVFGAGTDYALLLVARYREELRRHEDRHKAMAVAVHRAGPAIVRQRRHGRRRHAVPAVRRR